MNHNMNQLKIFSNPQKFLAYVLSATIFLSALPTAGLWALEKEALDISPRGEERIEERLEANESMEEEAFSETETESAVSENENASEPPVSSPSENAPVATVSAFRIAGQSALTLALEDFEVEGDTLVRLTEAGKAKIQTASELILPAFSGITKIGKNLFVNQKIQKLTLESGYTHIGSHAFQNMGLTAVGLPSSLTDIEAYAFADNELPAFPNLPNLNVLGDYALYNNVLREITLSARQLGEKALAANQLQTVSLSNAERLGEGLFFDNPDLKTLTMVQTELAGAHYKNLFNGSEKVSVILPETLDAAQVEKDPHYVVNPITVTIHFKDKDTLGTLKPSDVIKYKTLEDFPLTYTVEAIKNYRVTGDRVSQGQLVVETSDVHHREAVLTLLFVPVDRPQILKQNKQMVYRTNQSLNLNTLVESLSFVKANGEEIPALENGQLNPNISLRSEYFPSETDYTLPAPNEETTREVIVRFTDPDTQVSEELTLDFTFSDVSSVDEEIIPGEGWLYSDFRLGGSGLYGFSPSGLERLKTNKNVVLPGIDPTSFSKITYISGDLLGDPSFSDLEIDTVNFEKMDGLTHISNYAFYNSGITALLNFDRLKNLETIDYSAFSKNRLTQVDLTGFKKLRTIGAYSFSENALESLTLEGLDSLTYLGYYSFDNNTSSLKELTLRNLPKLTEIAYNAFSNNAALTSLTLEDLPELTRISNSVFYNTGLERLHLKDLPKLESISSNAFSNSKLKEVILENLPELLRIESDAFSSNKIRDLTLRNLPKLNYLNGFRWNRLKGLSLTDLPNLETIGYSAFSENAFEEELILENLPKLNRIESSAFYNLTSNGEKRNIQRVVLRNLPLLASIDSSSFSYGYFNELILDNLPLLNTIASSAFYSHKARRIELKDLTHLTSIGDSAFYPSSSELEEVVLKNLPELTTIGSSAFRSYALNRLETTAADLPKLTHIGSSAFEYSNLAGHMDVHTFPALESLGSNAFYDADFNRLTLSNHPTLNVIGSYAFYGPSQSYPEVVIENVPNLERIEDYAFGYIGRNYNTLRKVRIANNPKLKYLSGFYHNDELNEVVLENLPALEEIGNSAFYKNNSNLSLARLDLRPFTTLKKIGDYAFKNTALKNLELPNSIESIGREAYAYTVIPNVDLSHLTHLKSLGPLAFYNSQKTPAKFILPVTDEPIELGGSIVALKAEQLDFRKTPDVKLKLKSAKPFVTATHEPLVIHLDNDRQISWHDTLEDVSEDNPTIIFIDNVTDPDKLANAPKGIVINPGKIKVRHIDNRTGDLLVGVREKERFYPVGTKLSPLAFEGYVFREVQFTPDTANFASYDNTEKKVTILESTRDEEATVIFKYDPGEAVRGDDYHITVERAAGQPDTFSYLNSFRELSVNYVLQNVDLDSEQGVKLVVTLPPHASSEEKKVRFPKTIPGLNVTKAYFNAETKQIVYEIAQFNEPSPNIHLRLAFQFDPLEVPTGAEETVRAAYYLADGRRKGEEGISPPFKPQFSQPYFNKYVNYGYASHHRVASSAGSQNQYADFSLTYTFYPGNVQRRLDLVTLEDTLPTYQKMLEDGSVVTAKAVFDPDKNPDWVLNADQTKVSTQVHLENLDRAIQYSDYYGKQFYDNSLMTKALPPLILDYPRAVSQEAIRNEASISMRIHERAANDPESYDLSAERNDRLEISPIISANDGFKFDKTSLNPSYLPPFSTDRNKDYPWEISASLAKKGREYEGVRIYERTLYSGIEVWDYSLDTSDNVLEYWGFTPNQDLTLDLYANQSEPDSSRMTDERVLERFGASLGTYTLRAGERFYIPEELAPRVKAVRFKYADTVDSDTYENHFSEDDKARQDKIPFSLNIKVHSRLGEGKTAPNSQRYRYNYSRIYARASSENENGTANAEEFYRSASAYKRSIEAYPQIQVTKSSEYGDSSTNRTFLRSETDKINFVLSMTANWTSTDITEPWTAKNFRLVDLFPEELAFNLADIELNPEFVRLGGAVKATDHPKGTKLEFSAPSVPSSLSWIAKIPAWIKDGTPGDVEFDNRAYIYVDQNPNLEIRHVNAEVIPEENNASLTYAILPFSTAFNSSLVGNKYVRRVKGNGAWFNSVRTLPDEIIEYKLSISNSTTRELTHMEIFDIFPDQGDHVVVQHPDGSKPPRHSQFANTLVPFEDGKMYKARFVNYETKAVNPVNEAHYPFTLFSKLDGFPKTAQEGDVKAWIEAKKQDPAFVTTDPSLAKAIYIGGLDEGHIPVKNVLEIVLRMRVPHRAFEDLETWKETSAKNTFAFNFNRASRFKESVLVRNTLAEPTKSLKFRKLDRDTQAPLAQAVFTLSQEGEEDKVAVSDDEGWLYFSNVKYKNAYLKETTAPQGYKFDETVHTVTLGKAEYEADIAKGEAFDPDRFEETDLILYNEALPPPDPTDNRKFTVNVLKKDVQGENFSLVKFKLENLSTGESAEALTNTEGRLTFAKLRPGQYRLSEVSNLKRYSFVEPILFDLPLPEDFTSSSVHALERETDEQDPDHQIYTFEIHNTRFRVDLLKIGVNRLKTAAELQEEKEDRERVLRGEMTEEALNLKYANRLSTEDSQSPANTGLKLPKVAFALYETDQNAGDALDLEHAQTTFLNNLVTDAKGRVRIEGLKVNRIYKLQETLAAESYHLREEPVYFYVNAEGAVMTATGEAYVRPDLLLVSNRKATVKSSLRVKKIDEVTKLPLANASFRLLKWTTLNPGSPEETEEFMPFENNIQKTSENGEAYFRDLEYGRYRLEEVEAPQGYIRSPERLEIVVQPYAAQDLSRTVSNSKMKLRIEKVEYVSGPFERQSEAQQALDAQVDQTGLFIGVEQNQRFVYRRLAGARFELRENYTDMQGVKHTAVVQPDLQSEESAFTTYEYGYHLSDLGTYDLVETVSPSGYQPVSPKSIKLDQYIDSNRPESTLYIRNHKKQGYLHVAKFADRAHTVLPGVKFALYRGHLTREQLTEDKLVRHRAEDGGEYAITNAYGIVRYDHLDMGDYTLVELETVDPYRISEEPVHFTVDAQHTEHRFSFYNNLQTTTLKLRKTDDLGQPIAHLEEAAFELIYDDKTRDPITGVPSTDPKEVGVIVFNNVPVVGNYLIRELKAPKNFKILGDGRYAFETTPEAPLTADKNIRLVNRRQMQIIAEKQWIGGLPSKRPDVFFRLVRRVGQEPFEPVPDVPLKPMGKEDSQTDYGFFDIYNHEGQDPRRYEYSLELVNADGERLDMPAYDYTTDPIAVDVREETEDLHELVSLLAVSRYRSKKTSLTVNKTWRGGAVAEKPDLVFEVWRKRSPDDAGEKVENATQAVPKSLNPVTTFLNAVSNVFTGNTNAEDLTVSPVVFNDLDVTAEDGTPYIYFVKEVSEGRTEVDPQALFQPEEASVVATEGEANAQGVKPLSAHFVNVYHPPLGSIEATKTWIGGLNERPSTAYFLRRKIENGDWEESFESDVRTLDAGAYASNQAIPIVFENLPLTDAQGHPYLYSVVEFDGRDRSNLTFQPENYVKSGGNGDSNADQRLQITNTYVSPKKPFTLQKMWQLLDGETPPSEIHFILKRSTQALSETHTLDAFEEVARLTLNQAEHQVQGHAAQWQFTTPAYDVTDDQGQPYHYELLEVPVPGYRARVSKTLQDQQVNGFRIVNEAETTSRSVQKVWDNSTDVANPKSVSVQLKRNGKTYREVRLNEANQWQFTFENLPSYAADGTAYVYTLTETPIPAYTAQVVEENETFTVTNTRKRTSFEVSKTWQDESFDTDKPDKITVKLFRNKTPGSQPYRVQELTAQNNWTFVFENLPLEDDTGHPYVYDIEEVPLESYETRLNGKNGLLNIRKLTSVSVKKHWKTLDASYPDQLTYILHVDKGDGNGWVEINRVSVNKPENPSQAGSWNYTFTTDAQGKRLALASPSGTAYQYAVDEVDVPGYSKKIEKHETESLFNLYNTQELMEIKVIKRWIRGIKKPVELLLKRSSQNHDKEDYASFVANPDQSVIVGEEDGVPIYEVSQTYIVPTKDAQGALYRYTVEEPDAGNYESTIETLETEKGEQITVTNRYVPPAGLIEAKKVWRNVYKGLKIPKITVKLYRKYRPYSLGELVPNAEPIVLDAFVYDAPSSTYTVPLTWENIELTDEYGESYDFYIREFNEKGEERSPSGYYAYYSKLKIYNDYVFKPNIPDSDGTPPPIIPDKEIPNLPHLLEEEPNKDRVPNTGASVKP